MRFDVGQAIGCNFRDEELRLAEGALNAAAGEVGADPQTLAALT
jgi:hypothetical protein